MGEQINRVDRQYNTCLFWYSGIEHKGVVLERVGQDIRKKVTAEVQCTLQELTGEYYISSRAGGRRLWGFVQVGPVLCVDSPSRHERMYSCAVDNEQVSSGPDDEAVLGPLSE